MSRNLRKVVVAGHLMLCKGDQIEEKTR